jgi:Sulfatase
MTRRASRARGDGFGPAVGRPEPAAGARSLHLLAACGFVLAQPLYDLLANHPDFLVAHQLQGSDLLLLIAAVSLGVPLALAALTLGVGALDHRAGWMLQRGLIGILAGLLVLSAARSWPQSTPWRWALLTMVALVAFYVYGRSRAAQRYLGFLSLGALVFPVLLLASPGVRSLWVEAPENGPSTKVRGSFPVVLVIFDELPVASLLADTEHVDGLRFPAFAAFAETSTWFRQATTVAQTTTYAVPAIVTGRYPDGPAKADRESHPSSLFTQLEGRYNLHVVESATHLCGRACHSDVRIRDWSERLIPAALDTVAIYAALVMPQLGPAVDQRWTDFWSTADAEALTEDGTKQKAHWRLWHPPRRFALFMGRLGKYPRRTLHYLHVTLPHVPWQFLPDGTAYLIQKGRAHGLDAETGFWVGSEWELTQAQQRHLVQTRYADWMLGRIVSELKTLHLFDDSLMIVTSDHGTSFRRGDQRRAATETNLADVAQVPLFVKVPGQSVAEISERNVETIDIAPTISALLGFDLGDEIDGLSMYGAEQRGPEKIIYRSRDDVGAGDAFTFDADRLAMTAESVRQRDERFPKESLYAAGWDLSLIGQDTAAFERGGAAGAARVQAREAFDQVDPDHWILPVHLLGTVSLERPTLAPLHLIVALDGKIVAVTETYGELPSREVEFTALFDPATLRAGKMELEILLAESDGSRIRLSPLALE